MKGKDWQCYKCKKELGKLKLINNVNPLKEKRGAFSNIEKCTTVLWQGGALESDQTSSAKKKNKIKKSVYKKLYTAEIALKKANTRTVRYKERAQRVQSSDINQLRIGLTSVSSKFSKSIFKEKSKSIDASSNK